MLSIIKNGEKEILPKIERLELDKTLYNNAKTELLDSVHTELCAEQDLNLRSPRATDLQSVVIDHSTIDAFVKVLYSNR